MKSSHRTLATLSIMLGLTAVTIVAVAEDPPAGAVNPNDGKRVVGTTDPGTGPAPRRAAAERPMGRGDRPRGDDKNLTPEQINDALVILKRQDPELAERVEAAMKFHPEKVRDLLAAHWPRLAKLVDMKRNDPKLFDLSMREIRLNRDKSQLVGKLRQAADGPDAGSAQTEAMKKDLHKLVAEQFDLRQHIRRHEFDALSSRMARLQREIEARELNRDQVIDEHIASLLNPTPNNGGPKAAQPGF